MNNNTESWVVSTLLWATALFLFVLLHAYIVFLSSLKYLIIFRYKENYISVFFFKFFYHWGVTTFHIKVLKNQSTELER